MGPWPDLMADRGSALLSLLERDIRDPRGPRGEGLALGLGMSDKLERTFHHGPWATAHGYGGRSATAVAEAVAAVVA